MKDEGDETNSRSSKENKVDFARFLNFGERPGLR